MRYTPFTLLALSLLVVACSTGAETAPNTDTLESTPEPIETETSEPEMVGEPIGVIEETGSIEETTPEASAETSSPGGVTREELAMHNTQQDCWVGYQGTVYDLTAWLREHPGGANAIAPYCGTVEEFTEAYTEQHKRRDSTRIANRGEEQGALAE